MKRIFTFVLCLTALSLEHAVGQLTRVANTSLRLPQNPARQTGYRWEPAFGHAFQDGPVAIAPPPGKTNRLFVVEKIGAITLLTNLSAPKAGAQPFLDIRNRVVHNGEEGMLGLAFHPKFAQN